MPVYTDRRPHVKTDEKKKKKEQGQVIQGFNALNYKTYLRFFDESEPIPRIDNAEQRLLVQRFGIHEFSMAFNVRHAFDETDARAMQGRDNITRESGSKEGLFLAM